MRAFLLDKDHLLSEVGFERRSRPPLCADHMAREPCHLPHQLLPHASSFFASNSVLRALVAVDPKK